MQNKKFAVVTLAKEDQSDTIAIEKNEVKGSWIEAFSVLSDIVHHLTGKRPELPRNKDSYSVDTGFHLVQIWICDTPFLTL